jgi:hypothetical protein
MMELNSSRSDSISEGVFVFWVFLPGFGFSTHVFLVFGCFGLSAYLFLGCFRASSLLTIQHLF